jgi:uncharacterized phage protein (TIGR01671 family)
MLEDIAVGNGSIGFPSDDEEFKAALKLKGFDHEDKLPDWIYDTGEDWYHITDEERFILLQYTEAKDKNGVEINEGAIVEMKSYNYQHLDNLKWVVTYCQNEMSFMFICGDKKESKITWHSFEVIGNIYQNPELLKTLN